MSHQLPEKAVHSLLLNDLLSGRPINSMLLLPFYALNILAYSIIQECALLLKYTLNSMLFLLK